MKKKIIALVLCGVMALSVPVYAKGGSVSLSSDELQVPKSEKKGKEAKKEKKKKNNDITVTQSGWSVLTNEYSNDRYVTYGAKLSNSGSNSYGYVTLKIAIKDANGKIIKSDDYAFSSIAAGDTVFAADDINVGEYDPASVDFSVSYSDSDVSDAFVNDSSTSDFTLSNLSEIPDDFGTTITGEITSNAADDYSSVCITVLLEQDECVVGGFYGYADDVNSGETSVFEISGSRNLPEHNNVEISAHASY